MLCPKCSHEEAEDFAECPACGVLVDRVHGILDRRPVAPAAIPRPAGFGAVSADGSAWAPDSAKTLGLGAMIAALVYALPFTRFVFSYLAILVHEAGHTLVAWAMGYPAIPALDLLEGGGVSIRYPRSLGLGLLVVGTTATLVVLARRTRWLLPAVVLFALHLLLMLSPLHDAAIVAAGHGAELLFGGVALARGLSGEGTRADRVAWVFAGAFVLLLNLGFGLRLIFDPVELQRYAAARKGEIGMDLARLAEASGVGIDLFAALVVLAALALPPAAFLWARNR